MGSIHVIWFGKYSGNFPDSGGKVASSDAREKYARLCYALGVMEKFMKLIDLIWIVELLAGGFFMGAVVGSWLETTTFSKLSAEAYVAWHQAIDSIFKRVAPVMMLTWIFSTVAILALTFEQPPVFGLMLGVLFCLFSFVGVTLRIEVPINREIERWSLNAIPPHWDRLRRRWSRFQGVRAGISTLSLLLSIIALLVSQ